MKVENLFRELHLNKISKALKLNESLTIRILLKESFN